MDKRSVALFGLMLWVSCGGSSEVGRADGDAISEVVDDTTPETADEGAGGDGEDVADGAGGDGDAADGDGDAADGEVAPVCGDCDDGLACTEDGCGIDGICRHVVKAGFCAIAGRCVAEGFGSQCQVCAPAVDPTRYTALTGGTCDDGDPCTEGESCLGGICRGGEAVTCRAPGPCEVALGCGEDGCGFEARPDGAVCGPGRVCVADPAAGAGEAPGCVVGDPFPVGVTAWFDRASCPPGWQVVDALAGRSAVGAAPDGAGVAVGVALASGEDRRHTHRFAGTATAAETSFVGIVGGGNGLAQAGEVALVAVDEGASAGLPFVQLLPCEKVGEVSPGGLPRGVLVMAAASCPVGEAATTAYGRLVVGMPEGGSPGASFGRSVAAGASASPEAAPHLHMLSGVMPTPSHGVALASGCCGGGYASSSGLAVAATSELGGVDFPTLGVVMCELGSDEGQGDAAPDGMVVWATGASCPSGWAPHAASRGRLIVGAALGGDVGLTVNPPLTDREDRTHVHLVGLSAVLSRRNVAAADGPNGNGAAFGTVTATLASQPATSGLSFVQRMVCVKGAP